MRIQNARSRPLKPRLLAIDMMDATENKIGINLFRLDSIKVDLALLSIEL